MKKPKLRVGDHVNVYGFLKSQKHGYCLSFDPLNTKVTAIRGDGFIEVKFCDIGLYCHPKQCRRLVPRKKSGAV